MREQYIGLAGLSFLLLYFGLLACGHASTGGDEPRLSGQDKGKGFQCYHNRYAEIISSEGTTAEPSEGLKLAIEDVSFTCHEGFCDQYFDHCDLHIHYRTCLHENVSLPVATSTTCRASIQYKTASGDLLSSDGEPETVHRVLVSDPHDDADLRLNFMFSYYEGVIEAQLSTVECRVHRAELQVPEEPVGP